MKIGYSAFLRAVFCFIVSATFVTGHAVGDTIILDEGDISTTTQGGLAGTATFSVTAAEIPDVELLADFLIVDSGVDIVVNGTSLFPQFVDISQFGNVPVFSGTGETQGGGVNQPFTPNNNGPNGSGLPRLTVNSTSAGTTFSGATTPLDTQTTTYTPEFTVQNFSSLLIDGTNTITFFNLDAGYGASLQGDFAVTLHSTAIPEPGMTGLAIVALVSCLSTRRRRMQP